MTKDAALASSPDTLRIAIIGVGGIGSTFAFQLVRIGHHDVTVIARPGSPRLQQLQRDGGIVNTKREQAKLCVSDKLDEDFPYDLVLVTLPAHQAEAVLPVLQRSAAKWIQFMFNTFDPEGLRDAVGAARCSFGMPFLQGSIDANGKLNAKIGAGGQRTKMNNESTSSRAPVCRQCLNRICSSGFAAMFRCVSLLRACPLQECVVKAVPPGQRHSSSHEDCRKASPCFNGWGIASIHPGRPGFTGLLCGS